MSSMGLTIIYGGGGHAKVLIDAMLEASPRRKMTILDPDSRIWGTEIFGVPIQGDESLLPEMISAGADRFIIGVGSSSHTLLREKLFAAALSHGLQPETVCHPSAICSARASISEGVQLLAGCIVNASALVHSNAIINSGAIVEHDCVIGAHAHIAPGARLAGAVHVGERAHIGAGATVKQGISVGADSVVGAGAVVVNNVHPGSVVVGVPARLLRRLAI
ncbi:Putative acetyltransferase EpsM [Roseimaritima multifibrata]|uniref:Acetyltransferase EpsM n=2 Tax=Roseimaritima multifibrata TaxID=1930274 RepID=A0A517MLR8_9BACT|nr:Putative acetyltransferase EpsM [Roseimaritima multifibrata]